MSPTFTSVNPADPADVVGEFPQATADAVAAELAAAAAAQREWAAWPARRRAVLIGGVAHALAREARRLVTLITREEGKPLADAEAEVHKAVEQFHFASQLCYLVEGTTYPDEQPGVLTYTLRSPVGVVVAITPWNFPVSLPARKIGAALAAGNAVVFKPSPVTAATGALLTEIVHAAGVPAGVLRLVQGDDRAAMAALVGAHDVRAVSFTGSREVGDSVREHAHKHARLQSEMSGHNAAVVCRDADLAAAAREVVAGAFGLTGQACTAAARVLVAAEVFAQFRDAVAAEAARVRCGPGGAAGVTCGPVATRGQYDRLTGLLAAARDAGGEIVAEGTRHEACGPGGWYVTPTVLTGLPPEHPVNAREVFGPLLSLQPVDDLDAALKIINACHYGLAAAVHTADLGTAHRFAREVRCGMVKVNQRTTGNGIAAPFGGWKASSAGAFPEGGVQALDFFTETKTVSCQSCQS